MSDLLFEEKSKQNKSNNRSFKMTKKNKNSVELKNNKKKYIIISTILVILLSVIAAYIYTIPKASIIKDKFQFEYGEQVKLSVKDVLKADNEKIYKSAKIDLSSLVYETDKDYPNVGLYKVQISYKIRVKLHTNDLIINITDTVVPEFTKFQDSFEIFKGATKPEYLSHFEASDFSEVTISIDDSNVDYDKPGDYLILVKAIDIHNNETVKETTISIKANPVVNNSGSTCTSTVTEPYYAKGILIVNKKHPLPCGYAPGENGTAGQQIRALIAEMQAIGLNVSNSYSGYRSFSYQANLYKNYVSKDGVKIADTYSARPGFSEHQTGLAFDLKHGSGSLVASGSAEAVWVSENAHRYGFIVRYLKGKEHVTGYQYEPWHIRYIGDEATSVYNSGKTLEEYLDVEGGDYY